MEGDLSLAQGISRSAGIIPRTLYSLFHKLAEDKSEYSVRCSFVELYNEELRDLNALEFVEPHAMAQPMDNRGSHANNATAANGTGGGGLRIYDDKNAGSGVVIQGLEETLITSAEEGIKVLKRGSERRQIAATKCNEQSRYVALRVELGMWQQLTSPRPLPLAVDLTPSSPSRSTSRRRPRQEEKISSRSASSTSSISLDPKTLVEVERKKVAHEKRE